MKRTIVAMAVAAMIPVLGGCKDEAPPAAAPAKPAPSAPASPKPPAAAPATPTEAGPPKDYEIDGDHSNAEFSVKHLGISNVKGRFKTVEGKVHYDPANPANSTVEVKIATKSISTDVEKRDNHLRSPDFFDAEKNPEITFKSKKVTPTGNGQLDVLGDLTMHGQTHDCLLHVTEITPEQKTPWGSMSRGASANAVIKRSDWGLNWNKAIEAGGVVVGEDVKINIDVELAGPKPAEKK